MSRCECCNKEIIEFPSWCLDCEKIVTDTIHDDNEKEISKLKELLSEALPHIVCGTTEQTQLITAIGEALD